MKLILPLGVRVSTSCLTVASNKQGIAMNGMPKVLVVDNGERAPESALSAELAGMGYASVTTPFEAADDVLALIPSPAAVVLHMPQQANWAERKRFLELATRLRKNLAASGTPVIITGGLNGAATMLQNELSSRAVAAPDL
jgi:hypothetical protein